MEPVSAHVFVSGLVQGVFYRASAKREAVSRKLSGWVRNVPDGRVEAVFEGARGPVDDMVGWCRRGPSGARVDDVSVSWGKPSGGFKSFEMR